MSNKPLFDLSVYVNDMMPSKKRIFLASLIGWLFMIPIALLAYYVADTYIESYEDQLITIYVITFLLYLYFCFLLFMKKGYQSIGHFLLGIIYIDFLTGERLDRLDIIQLWFKNIGYSFIYREFYDAFYFFTSSYHQTITMYKANVLYCKRRGYKMYKHKSQSSSLKG